MDKKFELDTSLAFDKDKQSAIFAWCLFDAKFAEQASKVIKPEWFASAHIRILYEVFLRLYEENGFKAPTALEILGSTTIRGRDSAEQAKFKDALTTACQLTETYRLNLLRNEMDEWLSAVSFYQTVERATALYNSKQVSKAWEVVNDGALWKASTSFRGGTNEGFRLASERILDERESRLADRDKHLSYGMGFLNDALGVITPRELIIVGAGPGVGKTQLVTGVAKSVTQNGNPVHMFALEGDRYEIERRIKYGILSDAYFRWLAKNPDAPKEHICYSWWFQGRLEHVLGRFEKEPEIQHNLVESVKNLNVLYRDSGQFDAKVLQKQLLRVVEKTRLIIIDHLHYIDTDERSDENRGYKEVVKVIRDTILAYGVPVILVAHLRKADRSLPVLPRLEDFHGTSDVPKIATTAIMLGRAYDRVPPEHEPWLKPTYINVPKCRLEGERTWYTACAYFNPRTNSYQDGYVIGKMSWDRSSWEPLVNEEVPFWAENAYVPDRF